MCLSPIIQHHEAFKTFAFLCHDKDVEIEQHSM